MTDDYDLVCLSHLRWDFVFQRPQHLMTRFARQRRVIFFEEPLLRGGPPRLEVSQRPSGVEVAVPLLPAGLPAAESERIQGELLADLVGRRCGPRPVVWYQTPMAYGFARNLDARAVIYDCMDELSAFLHAPPELVAREEELLARADLVFTGGRSLFEAKRSRHPRVHEMPSSVDAAHFAAARTRSLPEPADQGPLARPRAGFFGVIDERLDLELLAALAEQRPRIQFVMLGPIVKIDPASLPRRPNLHWLGGKPYRDLPAYIAGWDVALLPFARNAATRFISPTKTPEYLAAGRPVVSTSIRDVVRPYGEQGLAAIADSALGFAQAIDRFLAEKPEIRAERVARADSLLADNTWDALWRRMRVLISHVISPNRPLEVGGDSARAG